MSTLKPFPLPLACFENLNIDICGLFPVSVVHFYILSVICGFPRWYDAIPLVDTQAETVIHGFLSGWVSWFGAPHNVTTDRGTQFTSAKRKECMEYLGTAHRLAHACTASKNGLV